MAVRSTSESVERVINPSINSRIDMQTPALTIYIPEKKPHINKTFIVDQYLSYPANLRTFHCEKSQELKNMHV